MGYWFGRERWGRGVATQTLALVVDELPIRPLHAHVLVHNVGSIRVLEKSGFGEIAARRRTRLRQKTASRSSPSC